MPAHVGRIGLAAAAGGSAAVGSIANESLSETRAEVIAAAPTSSHNRLSPFPLALPRRAFPCLTKKEMLATGSG